VTCATGNDVSVAVASVACVAGGVFVGEGSTGVKTAAVSVNCATTVFAAEVRTTATSGVGPMGVAEGPHATSKVAIKKIKQNSFGFMKPPWF
jgi:hypothetical protein